VRCMLRLYELGAGLGVAGYVAGTDDAKPRCYVRVAIAR
jgi:hypothetical protein